jgi:hypothetical protein
VLVRSLVYLEQFASLEHIVFRIKMHSLLQLIAADTQTDSAFVKRTVFHFVFLQMTNQEIIVFPDTACENLPYL